MSPGPGHATRVAGRSCWSGWATASSSRPCPRRRVASQEGASAPLPPGVGEPAAVGRVAEMRHLAEAGQEILEVPGPARDRVRDDIRQLLLSWSGTQAVPASQEEIKGILARF